MDYAGQPCDVALFRKLIGKRKIKIVQDAAHSLGSLIHGKPVGSQADVTTFSFFATKNITTGEGGAVSTSDPDIFRKAKEFARQGIVRDPHRFQNPSPGPWYQEVHNFGLNYRLTDFQSALGMSQLNRISEFKERRKSIHQLYNQILGQRADIKLLSKNEESDPMWHLYPIFVENRDIVLTNLRNQGVMAQTNYIPAYFHPAFHQLGYVKGICPRSEDFYHREISLPIHVGLSQSEVEEICNKLFLALKNTN